MSAEDNLNEYQFKRRQMSGGNWREKASYHVMVSGRHAGHVTQTEDSTRTGGMWNANMRGKKTSGHTTRREAAESVVKMYRDAGWGSKS